VQYRETSDVIHHWLLKPAAASAPLAQQLQEQQQLVGIRYVIAWLLRHIPIPSAGYFHAAPAAYSLLTLNYLKTKMKTTSKVDTSMIFVTLVYLLHKINYSGISNN